MKRKLGALVFAVLILLQVTILPADAAGEVYFTAVGENVLPLSDETMPFWSGGYLYLPGKIFTGNVWRSLDVAYVRTSRQLTILHSGGRSLMFELGKDYAKDSNGNQYTPGMIERGGEAFVPAYLLESFFDLQYSVTKVPHGHLVWLRKPGFGLTDKVFADAATSNMQSAYTTYMKSKETIQPVEAEEPELEKTPVTGKKVYLCMQARENMGPLLDELHHSRTSAAFFCTPRFLREQGDLLRRLTASGHTIGILAQGDDSNIPLEEQLEEANQSLEEATCGRTRLVYIPNATEAEAGKAERAGYRLWHPDLDNSGSALNGSKSAHGLVETISQRRGRVTVWLGNAVTPSGLRLFLAEAEHAEDRCLALTETVP